MELFDYVGLKANIHKTMRMVFQLCHYYGGMLVEVYTCIISREGMTYQDRLRQ